MVTQFQLLHQSRFTLQERIQNWQMSPPKRWTKLSIKTGDINISEKYSKSNILGQTSLSFIEYWKMLITGQSETYDVNKIRKKILQIKGKTLKCECSHFCHGEILCYLADHWNGELENNQIMINVEMLPLHFSDLLN